MCMYLKITIEKDINETLKEIKRKVFGEDASRIRNAFLLSKMILERNYTKEEIKHALELKSKDDYGEKIATTMNFNSKAYEKLKKISEEFAYSMADIIRAIILIGYSEKDDSKSNISRQEIVEKLNQPINDKIMKEKVIPVLSEENEVLKIFQWWYWNEKEIEDSDRAKKIYKYLDWNDYEYFDIINTFWKPFLVTAAFICKGEQRPLFKISQDGLYIEFDKAEVRANEDYIINIKKKFLAENYTEWVNGTNKHCGNRSDAKKDLISSMRNYPSLINYGKSIYKIPNFCPIPHRYFNRAKGFLANDSLSLMLDLINKHIIEGIEMIVPKDDKEEEIQISVDILKKWENWFINNRETAILQDYYYITKDNKIQPINDFRTQSIERPIPISEEELEEFFIITEMRTLSRKMRMIDRIRNSKQTKYI